MLLIDDVPYGILYSFQPEYLAQLQADNHEIIDAPPDRDTLLPTAEHMTFATAVSDFLRRRSC